MSSMATVQVSAVLSHSMSYRFNLVFQDRNLDLKSLMCDRYVKFSCHDFGMNVHILFSLLTTDPKYVKPSTPSNSKITNLLHCVENIFIYLVSFALILNPNFLPNFQCQ